jgi:hypothetical protein
MVCDPQTVTISGRLARGAPIAGMPTRTGAVVVDQGLLQPLEDLVRVNGRPAVAPHPGGLGERVTDLADTIGAVRANPLVGDGQRGNDRLRFADDLAGPSVRMHGDGAVVVLVEADHPAAPGVVGAMGDPRRAAVDLLHVALVDVEPAQDLPHRVVRANAGHHDHPAPSVRGRRLATDLPPPSRTSVTDSGRPATGRFRLSCRTWTTAVVLLAGAASGH